MKEPEGEEKKELSSDLAKNQKPLDEDLKIVVKFEAKSVKFSDNTDAKGAKKFLKLENSIKDIMNKGLKNTLENEFKGLSLQ